MITLDDKYLDRHIKSDELDEFIKSEARAAYEKVMNGTGKGADFLGWRDLPANFDPDELAKIKQTAKEIHDNNDILVSISIGGPYLAARSVIDALKNPGDKLEIAYAGKDLSSFQLHKLITKLEGKEWSIVVTSKSGTTTEPSIALRILRKKLEEKYGAAADKRIYVTTDAAKGTLHDLAKSKGWPMFVVPDDIGGRYSVMSAVGLLPIAAAGIDIDEFLRGAADQAKDNSESIKYAAIRNILYRKGYTVEALAYFEATFFFVSEWWKQLFGESEGKDNKASWLSSVVYSTDLHSMGQYMQDGKHQVYETFVRYGKSPVEIEIPQTGEDDGVEYLAGKNLSFVNDAAFQAAAKAHSDSAHGGVPVSILTIPERSAYHLGAFLYFMMMSCAVSAYILHPDGNPFDQPGVEFYKNNMFKLLGK